MLQGNLITQIYEVKGDIETINSFLRNPPALEGYEPTGAEDIKILGTNNYLIILNYEEKKLIDLDKINPSVISKIVNLLKLVVLWRK